MPIISRQHTRCVVQPLGVGGTGETFLCKRKDTGEEEAVKIIKRPIPMALKVLITNEITLQASIGEGNVNIVHAHSVILTETHLCLFMDFISGGTLTDYVSDRADTIDQRNGLFLDEDEARFLFTVSPSLIPDTWEEPTLVHVSCISSPIGPRASTNNSMCTPLNPKYLKLQDIWHSSTHTAHSSLLVNTGIRIGSP